MVITQCSFKEWFATNVSPEVRAQIRRHGMDIGIPGFIYDSQMAPLWDRFKDEIWQIALAGRSFSEFAASKEFVCPSAIYTELIREAATILAFEHETSEPAAHEFARAIGTQSTFS